MPKQLCQLKGVSPRGDGSEATRNDIEAFFEAAPPHASEKLETETDRVVDWLVKRAKNTVGVQSPVSDEDSALRREDVIAYILSPSMDLRHTVYRDSLMKEDKKEEREAKKKLRENLVGGTLVVDSRFSGLSKDGMLDEKASGSPCVIDDGEEWLPPQDDKPAIRFRVRSVTSEESSDSWNLWRERYRFETEQAAEGEITRWLLVEKWQHDAETEDDRSVGRLQELAEHHAWTEGKARTLAKAIDLPDDYANMLATAARLHDEGKRHPLWQQSAKVPRDGKNLCQD